MTAPKDTIPRLFPQGRGGLKMRNNKMNDVKIMVGNVLFNTEWVIDYIHDLHAEDYQNCSDEEKKAWVVDQFKEIINEEIDRLFEGNK